MVLSKDRLRWDTIARFDHSGSISGLLGGEGGTLLASLSEGESGGGVVQLSGQGRVLTRTEKGRPVGAMRMSRTPDGEIWVGNGGIGRLTRVGSVLKLEDHQLQIRPSKNVLAIQYERRQRKLWACYSGGLVVRDEHGAWTEFARDGLLVDGCGRLRLFPTGMCGTRTSTSAHSRESGQARTVALSFASLALTKYPSPEPLPLRRTGAAGYGGPVNRGFMWRTEPKPRQASGCGSICRTDSRLTA